jgi:hypothetical protein
MGLWENDSASYRRLNEWKGAPWAQADLAAENSGRPEQAITYYRMARAHRVDLTRNFAAADYPHAESAADQALKTEALHLIAAHPFRHLALTVPFIWRGALYSFIPLVIAFFHFWRRRDYEHALILIPALGMIAFYALVSFFTPRYSLPAFPLALCFTVMLIKLAHDRLRSRQRSEHSMDVAVAPDPRMVSRCTVCPTTEHGTQR